MATIAGVGQWIAKGVHKMQWANLGNADVGSALVLPSLADKTVQILGTFVTATVVIQGSNDGGTTWITLTDPQGNAISKTAAAIEVIAENPIMIRPSTSGGGGDSITVIITSQGAKR